MEPKFTYKLGLKTYSRLKSPKSVRALDKDNKGEPLTTKDAVKFLIQGSLKWRVCRFCLKSTTSLSELDEILEVGSSNAIFQVTIRCMLASFYPFQVADDPNIPNKICTECLDKTINSYLFTLQCERSERALHNYFEDISEKFDKLDPIERVKKRGRQKLNPNHNVIDVDYKNVVSYAEPLIKLINVNESEECVKGAVISKFECPKCWQVLPNVESLMSHIKTHPKSMWFNCRTCGKSFIKHIQYKRHLKTCQIADNISEIITDTNFKCNECGTITQEFDEHMQHMEKHKFKNILEHLVERKMDELCGVCMDKGTKMLEMNETIYLHGGYPELIGEKTLATVLTATVPEISTVHSYTGKKICQTCLNHALTSYIFVNKIRYVRNRLQTCVSLMLEKLDQVDEPENNLMVEIAIDTILPLEDSEVKNYDSVSDSDSFDDSSPKIEVLEDEFRFSTDSSEVESSNFVDLTVDEYKKTLFDDLKKNLYPVNVETKELEKEKNKANVNNNKLVNGYQSTVTLSKTSVSEVCNELVTVKKKRESTKKWKVKYTCPFCRKHFISDYFVKKHILKHIGMKITCDVCCKQFTSSFHLFEHNKMAHRGSKSHYNVCTTCGRGFADIKKFLLHKKSHRNIECPLCDKIFSTQKLFDSHFQRHAQKFKIFRSKNLQTCSFCEKEEPNENELSLHVNKSHLQIKPYSCDMCDKEFYTEYNLSSHKRMHSFHSKETCKLCDKTLNCRRDLVVHLRKHMGVKPYNCHVCSKSFFSETSQNRHMRKVHGGRFYCRFCKTMFNSKGDLKAHVKVAHNAI